MSAQMADTQTDISSVSTEIGGRVGVPGEQHLEISILQVLFYYPI